MFPLTAFSYWNSHSNTLLHSHAPHSQSQNPYPYSSRPLGCSPVFLRGVRPFAASTHWAPEIVIVLSPGVLISLREVDGRPSSAPSVKVSELGMKVCRSEECHTLTANFHQSNCGRGREGGGRDAGRPEAPSPLWGFFATYRATDTQCGRRSEPAVCSDPESTAITCNTSL